MNVTAIGWTDFSANPLKYRDASGAVKWACAKVSPGCTNCYSEALALRWNRGGDFNAGEIAKLDPFMDAKEIRAMLTSKKIAGKRVFVGDMTDLFGGWVPDDYLDLLFGVFALRPDVTWQILTKRGMRLRPYLDSACKRVADCIGYGLNALDAVQYERRSDAANVLLGQAIAGKDRTQFSTWPLPNVWIGVSVENREQERRIDSLPDGWLTFVSFEPLLEDLGAVIFERIKWAIVGGESGPRFRDCGVGPIVSLTQQAQAEGVPVFVKQDAHRLPGQQGRIPDEFWLKEFPA